jgi:hypothetical protein
MGFGIFEALKWCTKNAGLEWIKFDSICTNGAPAVVEKRNGYFLFT